MRIENERNCPKYSECSSRTPIPVEVSKSVNVTKTNTLHQFDTASIVGIPSPVGKVPIVFYVRETATTGRRGIIYFDDLDSVCWMYPESEHAEWCEQPYDLKYDKVEAFDNGKGSGFRRNHGIFELWVNVLRRWYNGQIMYRPHLKIQGCGRDSDGYPTKTTVETLEEKRKTRRVKLKKTKRTSCGCQKG